MRALLVISELSACSIRRFLLADVRADLLQFEPDGGYCITAGPEVLAGEVLRHKMVAMASVKVPWRFSVNPFLVASSGQPYNITTGVDPGLTGIPEARPAMVAATATCQGPEMLYEPAYGCFNLMPAPGMPTIARNSGRGPATASLGLRVSRTWLFRGGMARETVFPPQGNPGHGGSATKGVTVSLSTLNALNHTNLAPPNGDLSSPYFGQSLALSDLMGHMGKSSTYNRRIDLQIRFDF